MSIFCPQISPSVPCERRRYATSPLANCSAVLQVAFSSLVASTVVSEDDCVEVLVSVLVETVRVGIVIAGTDGLIGSIGLIGT